MTSRRANSDEGQEMDFSWLFIARCRFRIQEPPQDMSAEMEGQNHLSKRDNGCNLARRAGRNQISCVLWIGRFHCCGWRYCSIRRNSLSCGHVLIWPRKSVPTLKISVDEHGYIPGSRGRRVSCKSILLRSLRGLRRDRDG